MPALLEQQPATNKYDAAVRGTLDETARKIRSADALAGGLIVAAGVLLYAVAAVLLDRWLDLPAWGRQLGLVGMLVATGTAGWYLIARPLRRQVNPRYVARQMEGTIGDAKNAVINWVDLHDRDIPGSVKTALGQKAAAGLSDADPSEVVSSRRMAWAGGAVAVLVGVLAVLFLLFKSQFLSLLGRAFNPFSDKGIAARTSIELVEPAGDRTITDGQQLAFIVRVTGNIPALGSPEQVRLKVRYTPDATDFDEYPLVRGETIRDYSLTAGRPILQNGIWYRIAAGDAETPEYRVVVRARPMIQTFEARYEYPEYLRLKPDMGRPNEPRLNGYRGTNVTLTVKTNRTVKLGTMTVVANGQDSAIPGEVVGGAKDSLQFKLTLQERGEYSINFTSNEGEVSGPTAPYPIDVDIDAAPVVNIVKPEQEEITLPTNGLLEVDAKIEDDHGIAGAVLRFKLAGVPNPPAIAPKAFRDGKSFKRDTDGSFPLNLEYKDSVKLDALKTADGKPVELKPDAVLEYWLEATDNCTVPAANIGKSKVQRVKLAAPPADPMQQQKTQQQQQQEKRQQEEKKNNQQQDEKNKTEKRDSPQPQNRDKDPNQPDQPKDPQQNGEKDPNQKPQQDPNQKPDPKNPMESGSGENDPKSNPEDQKNQDKAKELENKIKDQESQAGEGKGDPGQQEKSKTEEKPAQGKPGDKGQPPPEGASEGKQEPPADPMNPMDKTGGEGKKGDIQQPNKSEAKSEPKPGEDPNGTGDPDAMPKEGPKPDDKQSAGSEKSSKPQPGEAEKPPLKPGEKPRDSDPAGGKGASEPTDPKDPMQPEQKQGEKDVAKNAGKGKSNGDVKPGEQKEGAPEPKGGDSTEQPKPGPDQKPADQKPADGKGKEPVKQGTAKPEKPDPMAGKSGPAEGKEPPPADPMNPMKGEKESGEGKGEGAQPDPMKGEKPVEKGEQKAGKNEDGKGSGEPDPKNPNKNPMGGGNDPKDPPKPQEGGKGDAAKQKEIEDAVKDLGSDDKAKRDAAKEKLDKTVGPEARKKAEEIAEDAKSNDPKRQEDARKKLEEMAKQAGKSGGGSQENGKPRELTEQEKKELQDAAKDLADKDEAKRKEAERKLDEKIGKDAREQVQKDLKDLTGDDPEKAKAAKEKLERMAKEAKNRDEIPQGGNPGKGPDGKPLEDNPENRLKSAELQLENFKKYKDNPEFLKKAGYSPAEYEKFLKGYEETVARQRTAVEAAKAAGPRTPGTDPKQNLSDGRGADTRLVGPTAQSGGPGAGGASEAPPGFGDAHKRFIEEAMKAKPKK